MDRSPRGPRRCRAYSGLRLRLSARAGPRFDLQGHRGARGLFPENTLEGFAAAVALGLDSFEIDIAVTRDGIPVLHHDVALNPDIARRPDGRWLQAPGRLIRDLSMAELAAFDVGRLRPGSAYAARYPTQAPIDGAGIPTLEAVLRARTECRFNIELKLLPDHSEWTVSPEAMVERVLSVIDAAGAAHRVMIQSFDWRAPRHAGRLRPGLPLGWLTEAKTIAAAPLWRGVPIALGRRVATTTESIPDAIAAEGGGTWTPFHAELTRAGLDRAHRLGIAVIPWTVNEVDDMRRLIGWGVDGLISDWPDRALALLPARTAG